MITIEHDIMPHFKNFIRALSLSSVKNTIIFDTCSKINSTVYSKKFATREPELSIFISATTIYNYLYKKNIYINTINGILSE